MNIHEKYIRRCIEIAKNGIGPAAPNPSVGCVIVCEDQIIGEGYTSPYGGPHAEVNAIASVKDKTLLAKAQIYVTLEPCSHYGKTPPCADLITSHGIPEAYVGLKDPHEKVAGRGIKKLEASGCKVTSGILEKECREHHKRFLTFHEKKRPYIILKWAQSEDGFIAPLQDARSSEAQPHWISHPHSRQRVHQWRSEEQAILVGTQTVIADNPKLNTRLWEGKDPIRIFLDRTGRVNPDSYILDGSQPTLVFTENTINTYKEAAETIEIDFSENIPAQICDVLYERNISSVMVEGGARTLQTFIEAGLWDEARVFTGNQNLGAGIPAPTLKGVKSYSEKIHNDTLDYIFPYDS
ncbi:MAG: bifunctional diaminohydroxyphosphoribosylaminopyrimidine deaminase/5-amino-6-(5-phosphoribosylamino)uracil reductase RibD [Bacteroidota bacterium]